MFEAGQVGVLAPKPDWTSPAPPRYITPCCATLRWRVLVPIAWRFLMMLLLAAMVD